MTSSATPIDPAEASPLDSPTALSVHASGDPLLTALLRTGGPVADLVNAFPGRERLDASSGWLESWFTERATAHFHGTPVPDVVAIPVGDIARATADDRPRSLKVERLLSVHPQWFRGFRRVAEPIPVDASLLLIDGRNSTGKTSLAEALEWLFKGELTRRTMGGNGNARELEACVGHHFRPDGEDTVVEAVFRLGGGEALVLKRVLDEDYGPHQTSVCQSRLFCDDVELTPAEATALLDDLFGGAPPLLMQHTLRLFVHSTPADRRMYFERLLNLDEIAALIERAVLGGPRLAELRRPGDQGALASWRAFKDGITAAERPRLTRLERRPPEEITEAIRTALVSLAHTEFGEAVDGLTYAEVRARVEGAQRAARQRQFPLLASLRPKRGVDDALLAAFSAGALRDRLAALQTAVRNRDDARASATEITNAQLAIAGAMAALTEADLLPAAPAAAIVCPVCEYEAVATLTVDRMHMVRTWQPIREALDKADARVADASAKLREHLQTIYRERKGAYPEQPDDEVWSRALHGVEEVVSTAATAFRERTTADAAMLEHFDTALIALGKRVTASPLDAAALADISDGAAEFLVLLDDVVVALRRYADALTGIEQAVGTQSGADSRYAARERWLATGAGAENIAEDLAWEQAKAATATLLEQIRNELKAVRQQLLENRRTGFNEGIAAVWSTLRGDTYSVFSQLHIPEPRGKGFKVEIEVKARLDDGTQQEDVDALRVFSESQVHALGIAAFVTRAKMLGHRVLIFDDPVQSMDEEHFHTFAAELIPHLLDAGFQVVVLTHNYTFARGLRDAHRGREDFTSLKIGFSREGGTTIDLGEHRLKERLAKVDQALQKGRLEDGWIELRKGIERLLTILRDDHPGGGTKNPLWHTLTAGQMFKQGAGDIIRTKAPKLAERLPAVIDMTAAAAHDAAVRGETDLRNGVALVRNIATQFGIKD